MKVHRSNVAMAEPKMRWGEWVKARAHFVGLPEQKELAAAVGCSREHVSRLFAMKSPPKSMRRGLDASLVRTLQTTREILFDHWKTTLPERAERNTISTDQHVTDGQTAISNAPTNDLVRELARRLRLDQLDADDALKQVEAIDWSSVGVVNDLDGIESLAPKTRDALQKLNNFLAKHFILQLRDSLLLAAQYMHNEMPGPARPAALELRGLMEKRLNSLSENESYKAASNLVLKRGKEVGLDVLSALNPHKLFDVGYPAKPLQAPTKPSANPKKS